MQPIRYFFHRFATAWVLLMLCCLLSSCALPTKPRPASTTFIPWSKRQAALAQITSWQIQTTVSIRQPSRTDLAHIQWTQSPQFFTIRISAPLSLETILLSGNQQRVVLQRSARETYTARSPEELLQQFGWKLPVSRLYYWIRGLPAPNMPVQHLQLDAQGRLISMQQGGWEIHYLDFQSAGHLELPQKMTLAYPGLAIKIVIQEWKTTVLQPR